jgi:hypothetical protein
MVHRPAPDVEGGFVFRPSIAANTTAPVTSQEASISPIAGSLAIEATVDLPKPARGVRLSRP